MENETFISEADSRENKIYPKQVFNSMIEVQEKESK